MSTNPRPPTAPDRGFVYLHGAGLDTSIWDDLAQELETAQYPLSFPGRGGCAPAQANLGLYDYVQHVNEQLEAIPAERLIVVTHSIGGVVGLEAAEKLSTHVAGFVGICAAIPPLGRSFLSCHPVHQRVAQRVLMRLAGTKPPDAAIRRSLGTGLSDEHTAQLVEGFVPESQRLYTDRIEACIPDVPTLYVKTTNDAEFGPSLQDRMISNLGADDVATIDAGHMPMLSHPREVARILERFERAVAGDEG